MMLALITSVLVLESKIIFMQKYLGIEFKLNITTQSVASPRTPHMSMIPIVLVTLTFEM